LAEKDNHINSMEDKEKQLKKLALLQEEPNLAFLDELELIGNKLNGIKDVLSDLNSKDVKTYDSEIQNVTQAISDLQSAVNTKDLVVNLPDNADKLNEIISKLSNIVSVLEKEQSVNVKLVLK